MDQIILVRPALLHKEQAQAMVAEHIAFGENEMHGDNGLDHAESYTSWLETIANQPQGNWVPSDTYFAIRAADSQLVGMIHIRHSLNDYLFSFGGHIGYSVRPALRRRGYATQMLTLALQRCRRLGLIRVLLTCDDCNQPSAKTIEKCGGVMENRVKESDGNLVRRIGLCYRANKLRQSEEEARCPSRLAVK